MDGALETQPQRRPVRRQCQDHQWHRTFEQSQVRRQTRFWWRIGHALERPDADHGSLGLVALSGGETRDGQPLRQAIDQLR
jgi:hypothetical protein